MLLYRCYLIYFTAFLAVITASCGFKPLYNINDPIDFSIQTIEIGEIKGDAGRTVRTHLINKIGRKGLTAESKKLAVKINRTTNGIVTDENTRITRYEITLEAQYALFEPSDLKGEEPITKGNFIARASYNVLLEEISLTLASEKAAIKKASMEIANMIVNDLAIYFSRN